MELLKTNQTVWDNWVANGNKWTIAVSKAVIEAARCGNWNIVLTPEKPVPRNWFPDSMRGLKVLCLAAGGGQQGPIIAAAGADVIVYDLSAKQLAQDEKVASENDLNLRTIQGDMRDLSQFGDNSFDMIINPISNCFIDDLAAVWQGCYRILKPGGSLLAGCINPIYFVFDLVEYKKGNMFVKYRLPYCDIVDMPPDQLKDYLADGEALSYSHTLETLIGGQTEVGFAITGFYEDNHGGSEPIDRIMDAYIATKAVKLF